MKFTRIMAWSLAGCVGLALVLALCFGSISLSGGGSFEHDGRKLSYSVEEVRRLFAPLEYRVSMKAVPAEGGHARCVAFSVRSSHISGLKAFFETSPRVESGALIIYMGDLAWSWRFDDGQLTEAIH